MQAEVFNSEIGDHIIPWYQASVDSDRNNREIENGVLGEGSTRKSILQDGLMPATQTSAKVWRAFMRTVNLLAPPKILNEPEIMADVLEMWEKRNERPAPPPLGPERSEMMDLLGLKETA